MDFENTVEGAFDDRSWCSAVGGFAGLGTGTVVTAEALTARTHGLATAVIRTTAVATATTRTSAFEATKFAASWRTIEARWSLVATWFSAWFSAWFKTRAGITGRSVTTATTTAAATSTSAIAIAGFTFGWRTSGRFFTAGIVGSIVSAEELITPIGKVVSFGLVATGRFGFGYVVGGCGASRGVEIVALATIAARAAVSARWATIGGFDCGGFVVTKIQVVGAEVPHAGFGFDIGDFAFESS
jgi:hypothetical protein